MRRPKTIASEDRGQEGARTGASGSQGGRQRRRATLELMLAVLAAAGAVWSWFGAQTVVTVAPVLEGEPQTMSVAYSAPMVVLMLLLATVAGIVAVDGIARLRRTRLRPRNSIYGR